jgi:hypothetical protein
MIQTKKKQLALNQTLSRGQAQAEGTGIAALHVLTGKWCKSCLYCGCPHCELQVLDIEDRVVKVRWSPQTYYIL